MSENKRQVVLAYPYTDADGNDHDPDATVDVSIEEEDRLLHAGLARRPEPQGYNAMKVADLKAEIDRRNVGRSEADLLSTEGKKDDLIAALGADDSKEA